MDNSLTTLKIYVQQSWFQQLPYIYKNNFRIKMKARQINYFNINTILSQRSKITCSNYISFLVGYNALWKLSYCLTQKNIC